jgi:predicted acylesterase/phospholipase RssA
VNPSNLRIGIVLGGWAPAMTLMSGAMLGFIDEGIEFEVVSTSGIGGFIGLLYLAPKDQTRDEALRELPNLFVSDLLHLFVPLNFKEFYKHGPFAQPAYELRKKLPKIDVNPASASPLARLVNDWMDLVVTALTPTTLETYRNGLMSQVSMIEDRVNFAALRAGASRFYLSAFDVAAKAQRVFRNQDVGADAYRAAQAMFLLFPPERAGGRLLTTGATHDPTGLQAIWLHERKTLDMVIVLDPVSPAVWREPRNIHDAFQLMLLNPIMALQALMLAMYADWEFAINPAQLTDPPTLPRLYRVPFDVPPCDIPSPYYPQMLEWTHDNAVTLEQIGYCAAKKFAVVLQSDLQAFETSYRYARRREARSGQFLTIFRDLHLFEPEFWEERFVRDHGAWGPRPSKGREPEER